VLDGGGKDNAWGTTYCYLSYFYIALFTTMIKSRERVGYST